MPSGRMPRSDFTSNRRRILDAAAELLTSSPDVSVRDVAAAAGVTRTTVYRHFADRDALLDALATQKALELLPQVMEAIDNAPLAEAIDRFAQAVVTHTSTHRHLLTAVSSRLEELARRVVDDDPLAASLQRRRAAGELVSPLSDRWLASCVRALTLAAVFDERSAEVVTRDLAATLRLLLLGD